MKKSRDNRLNFFLAVLFILFYPFSASSNEDSLLTKLKTARGLERIKALNELSGIYIKKDPKKFLVYNKEAITLCRDSLSELKADAVGMFANYLRLKGKTKEAKGKLFELLEECKTARRENFLPDAYSTLAMTYKKESLYDSAIYYSIEAEKLFRKYNDVRGLTLNLSNSAGIYVEMEDFAKAGKNYFSALKLATDNNMKQSRVSSLIGIGIFYGSKGNIDSAVYFLEMAAKEAKEVKDYDLLSTAYSNLGTAHVYNRNGKLALSYYLKNYEIKKLVDSKVDMATSLCDMANVYTQLKKFDSAYYYVTQANMIADSLNSPATLSFVYDTYIFYFSEKKDFKSATEFYQKKAKVDKKFFNEQKQNSLNELETLYEMDKKEAELKLRDEQLLNNENKLKQQKTVTGSIILGLILVLLLAVNIFRNLQRSKRANQIITQQKIQVENQKMLIEEKQKEIVDSINYAKRIQKALLASNRLLADNLKEHFILFKPKDIVSGDFYWASHTKDNKFLFVTADSTGHGVPGAMMSMLNIACLNEAVNERGISRANAILNYCREKIIRSLSEDGSKDGGSDGMDGSVIILDNGKLNYSSANGALFIVRNKELIELNVDRMPVGKHERQNESFAENEIEIFSGDIIYALTDGYADQFGGETGKKFMKKQLKKTLLEVCMLPLNEQKESLDTIFGNWKGQLEQVDDVTVIGIKI